MDYVVVKNTGDSKVSVSDKEVIRLNNSKIRKKEALQFVDYLLARKGLTPRQKFKLRRLEIEFSYKQFKWLFGQAYTYQFGFSKVILYRHSVWVFLHELSHILRDNPRHDQKFASILDSAYFKYIQFKKYLKMRKEKNKDARRIVPKISPAHSYTTQNNQIR